jgi:hypothetical protein
LAAISPSSPFSISYAQFPIMQRDLSEVSRQERVVLWRKSASRDFGKILLDETALQSMWIVSIQEEEATSCSYSRRSGRDCRMGKSAHERSNHTTFRLDFVQGCVEIGRRKRDVDRPRAAQYVDEKIGSRRARAIVHGHDESIPWDCFCGGRISTVTMRPWWQAGQRVKSAPLKVS